MTLVFDYVLCLLLEVMYCEDWDVYDAHVGNYSCSYHPVCGDELYVSCFIICNLKLFPRCM